MKASRVLFAVLALAAWGDAAFTFEVGFYVTPVGEGNELTVTIEDASPPASGNWVGYAVVRFVHGICEDAVFITEILPFDTPIVAVDNAPPTDLAFSYVVALVDVDGVPGIFAGWNAIETLGGLEHPVIRGRLQSGGVFGGGILVACPDMCWELPFLAGIGIGVQAAPDHVVDAIDTGQVFDIYGIVDYWWEGPFFTAITEGIATECNAVATTQESWSAIKRRFK